MTNTSDKQPTKSDDKKKPKAKGPIRFEAILPVGIILTLIYLYFAMFFDGHLRRLLEFTGTSIHGAEVNIEKIESSFWGGYFRLIGLQITDKSEPSRNLIQIQRMNFELVWDALLRAKFVVKEASIDNIMAHSPRKRPGRVIPPKPPKSGKNQTLQQVESQFIEQTKDQFNDNVLGDVASILEGSDPASQLKQIQADLKAEAKVKELENALNEKKKAWDERINNLPQKPQIDALVERSKLLKFNSKNPKQFANDVKELEKILKEGDKIVKEFNSASSSLKSDVQGFNNDFKSLDDLIKQDIKDLQTRLKIPSINVADFSEGLFGRVINENLGKYKKYIDLARQHMPEKKDKSASSTDENQAEKKIEIKPRSRSEGEDFSFPKAKAYPTFWLQLARITSKEDMSEYSGNLGGEIRHLSTQPFVVGIPMTIDIQGNFPKQEVMGLQATIVVDHTTEDAYEKFDFAVGSYPVNRYSLSKSSDVKLAITGAKGSTNITGISRGDNLHFSLENKFQDVAYDIDAKSKTVKEILTNITNDIPYVNLNAKASGPWRKLSWSIRSNLGDELSRGFKKQLQAKIDDAKKQLDQFVNSRIQAERDKLTGQYNEIKNSFEAQVASKKKELDSAKKQAETQMNKQKSAPKAALKEEGKKVEKQLKKLFGK